jgi:hypothetical protein
MVSAPNTSPSSAQPLLPEPDKEAWSAPKMRLLSGADTSSGKSRLNSMEVSTGFGDSFGAPS